MSRSRLSWVAMLAVSTSLLLVGLSASPGAAAPTPFGRASWPVTVTIQTVPALAGVALTFDGMRLRTDHAGRVRHTADHDFATHVLTLVETERTTAGRRYRFVRWSGQRDPNQAYRSSVVGLPMRSNYTITAAFSVDHAITASVVDQHGRPIDAARVNTVTVKSDTGRIIDLPLRTRVWVEGSTPSFRKSLLSASSVSYSLHRLMVGGTNAIEPGTQRFRPSEAARVVFVVALHDLTVTSHAAMWHSRTGDGAVVTGPDGTALTVPFTAAGVARLTGLPQGHYRITVRRPGGVVMDSHVSLGADRTVDVAVARWVDLMSIGGGVLVAAALMLVVGRVRWRRAVRRVDPQLCESATTV